MHKSIKIFLGGFALLIVGGANLVCREELIKEYPLFGIFCLLALFLGGMIMTWGAKMAQEADKPKPEHKAFLLKLYKEELLKAEKGGFYENLFNAGIRRLTTGQHPRVVENWVIRMEKMWNKF